MGDPCHISLWTKATKLPRFPKTDVSKISRWFMIQMGFSFFNVESIRGFTSTLVVLWSSTSYPFGFPYRRKHPSLDTLNFFVTTLRNQDKKVVFIRVDEDGAPGISYEFTKSFHSMNIIVHTTCADVSSIIGKSESPKNTVANITRDLLLNSSHKK